MDIFKPILKIIWSFTEKADNKRLAQQKLPDSVETIENIAYVNDDSIYHLLDIHFPKDMAGKEKLPLIIDIHGGGWWYGTKEINKPYSMELAKHGFVVANISYRLVDSVRLIDQVRDVFSFLLWLENNIDNYPIDANNIFLTGDSAGGHLTCITALLNSNQQLRKRFAIPDTKIKFNAVCATSPVIDLVSPDIMMNANLNSLLGTTHHKKSPYYDLVKLQNIFSAPLPAFYIVTSGGDFVRNQAYKLHKILDDLKVENTLCDYSEKYDGRKLPHVFSVIMPTIAPAQENISKIVEFFRNHM